MTGRRKIERKMILLTFALLLVAPFSFLSAQIVEVKPKTVIIVPTKPKIKQKIKTVFSENDESAEKSIAVSAKINISLSVCQGNLKIHGWERSEIRAFIGGGSEVGFRVQQKDQRTGTPVWVMVVGFNPAKNEDRDADECLSGDEIELDVPRGAIVNVKSSESETTINSVRKVTVENVGGDIFLNDIAEGVVATTYEGDVTVENSSGSMSLASTSGNIVAFGVNPEEIGDVFKAKTGNGVISLQKVGHRQMDVSSNSGSIRFSGDFLNGGQYKLGTQNGAILLSIPEQSSFKLNASYGFGSFDSAIPLQNPTKNLKSGPKSITASAGKGEAILNLVTVSGAIRIRKQ